MSRRVVKIGAYVLASAATLLVIVIVAALSGSVQTRVARHFLRDLNAQIKGSVSFEFVRASPFGRLELLGAELRDDSGRVIARVETLYARVIPRDLMDNRAHVYSVDLRGVQLTLDVDSTRGINVARAFEPRQSTPARLDTGVSAPWSVRIDELLFQANRTLVTVNNDTLLAVQEWLLSGRAGYAPDSLDYSLTLDIPRQIQSDLAGVVHFSDTEIDSLSGQIGWLIDSSLAARLSEFAAPLGKIDGHADYQTNADSLFAVVELNTSRAGNLKSSIALPFPPEALAGRGTITLDSLIPSVMWSDSTPLILSGEIAFVKQADSSMMNGWHVDGTLRDIAYDLYRVPLLILTAATADSALIIFATAPSPRGSASLRAEIRGLETDDMNLQGTARFDHYPLSESVPDVPDSLSPLNGEIAAQLDHAGTDRMSGTITANLTSLGLGPYFVDSLFMQGRLLDSTHFSVDTLWAALYSAHVNARAQGAIDSAISFAAEFSVPELAAFRALSNEFPLVDSLSGSVAGEISGVIVLDSTLSTRTTVEGNVNAWNIALGADSVREIAARIQEFGIDSLMMRGLVRARGIRAYGQLLDSVSVSADGVPSDIELDLRLWAKADTIAVNSEARVQQTETGMVIQLERLIARAYDVPWELASPATLTIQDSSVNVDAIWINSAFGTLIAAGTIKPHGEQDFVLEISGVRVAQIAQLFRKVTPDAVTNARIQFTGPSDRLVGEFYVTMDSVTSEQGLLFDHVIVNAETNSDSTNLDLFVGWHGDTLAIGRGVYPLAISMDSGVVQHDDMYMRGDIVLKNQPLDFLTPFLQRGTEIGGNVSGNFSISGTPAHPDWAGELQITDAKYHDPGLGIDYSSIDVRLNISRDTLRVAQFEAHSGGKVTGSGDAIMAFPLPKEVNLKLEFDKFDAVNSPQVRARVSGNVSVSGSPERLDANGTIQVTEGLYRITQSTTKNIEEINLAAEIALLRGDTVAPGPSLAEQAYQSMSHAIYVDVPGNFWLRGSGLNIELAGGLWLYKNTNSEPYVNGEVFVRNGTVETIGREFRVPQDSGRVTFTGAIDNPEVDITAYYKTPTGARLSVTLSGTISEMRTTLSGVSKDGTILTDQEMVKELFASVNPFETSGGDGSKLETKIAAAGLGQLSSVVGKAAGVDVLEYRTAENGSLAGGSLEVGTYVTDRLFVRVLQPIEEIQHGQEVTVEYRLLDWLKLVAQQYGQSASELKTIFQIEWR